MVMNTNFTSIDNEPCAWQLQIVRTENYTVVVVMSVNKVVRFEIFAEPRYINNTANLDNSRPSWFCCHHFINFRLEAILIYFDYLRVANKI